jgi:1,4-dihydroxy-2-naphthoate octaprenyltransferase
MPCFTRHDSNEVIHVAGRVMMEKHVCEFEKVEPFIKRNEHRNFYPEHFTKKAYLNFVLQPSTLQLLRFHFSLFLLPVYLFAISQLPAVNWPRALLCFFILHVLVYPASNGYNSYMDRDETPIGGLKNPMQPTQELFYVTIGLDVLAIACSLFISVPFAVCILLYILASRAYSYRGIRLKRFPYAGFATVFFFQGALVFFCTYHAAHPQQSLAVPLLPCLTASLLIGASYPLTQIYQHEADKQDGIATLSYKLGKRGTFVFSMGLFLIATGCMYAVLKEQMNYFLLFLLCMFPVVLFFLYWMRAVWQHEKAADFKNSLRMNVVSTVCMLLYFSTLIALKYIE